MNKKSLKFNRMYRLGCIKSSGKLNGILEDDNLQVLVNTTVIRPINGHLGEGNLVNTGQVILNSRKIFGIFHKSNFFFQQRSRKVPMKLHESKKYDSESTCADCTFLYNNFFFFLNCK